MKVKDLKARLENIDDNIDDYAFGEKVESYGIYNVSTDNGIQKQFKLSNFETDNKARKKSNIKLQVFQQGEITFEADNYEEVFGFCPRPLKIEVTLTTIKDVEDLVTFLNEVKVALIPNL